MGRPPNTDPAVTRRRILEAAVDLFGEYGREGAAIREVARRSDVSMSTVLHHFGSKQGLFDACVAAMFDELARQRDQQIAAIAGVPSPREAVDRVVRQSFRFARRHRRLLRVILCESVTTGHVPADVRQEVMIPTVEAAADLVSRLCGHPPTMARLLVLSVNHLITRFVLTDPEELLATVTHGEARSDSEAWLYQTLEDHLARSAAVLIFGSDSPST